MIGAFGIVLIVIFGGALIGCLAWVIHLNLRARRLGLPAPSLVSYFRPPSSNPLYQGSSSGRPRGGKSGGGFLGMFGKKKNTGRGEFAHIGGDDGVWDSRGYYEEDQEMGLRPDDARTGRRDWNDEDDSPPRGRSRSRSPRYDAAAKVPKKKPAPGGAKDPFSDSHQVRPSTDTTRSSVFHEEAL